MLKNRENIVLAGCLLGLLALCSYLFYRNFFLLFLFFPAYLKGKPLFEKYRHGKQNDALLREFRDFLFSLSASFATGRHMREAMHSASSYLREIYGKDSILAEKLDDMCAAIEETGASEAEVFSGFAEESDLEDIRTFIDVYCTCIETGGNMVLAVDKAAEVIGEKIKLEGEIKAMIAQKKFEGRLIAVMPFVMLFFLQLMAPSYLEIMYTTIAGRLLMTMALLLNLFTVLWIERMTNIEL